MSLVPENTPLAESFRKTVAGSAPLTGSVVAFFHADNAVQVWSNGPPNAPPLPVPLVPLLVQSEALMPFVLLLTFRSHAVPVQSTCALALKS
jgi:hypothetical protein